MLYTCIMQNGEIKTLKDKIKALVGNRHLTNFTGRFWPIRFDVTLKTAVQKAVIQLNSLYNSVQIVKTFLFQVKGHISYLRLISVTSQILHVSNISLTNSSQRNKHPRNLFQTFLGSEPVERVSTNDILKQRLTNARYFLSDFNLALIAQNLCLGC